MVIFFGSLRDCGHHNIIMWKQQCQHLAKHPLWKKNHGFGTIWVRVKDDNFHFWWNIITTRYHIFPSINRKVETKKIHYLNIPNKTTITQHHWVYWCIKHAESRENSKKIPFKETSPTNKHVAGPPMLKESQSLISASLQWFITLDSDYPKSRNPLTTHCNSPTFTQRWGGYDERLLFGDNNTDNLPTRRRASISFSSAFLLSNTVLEHERQMLLTRIIKQGKDEKHWLTSTAGTPPAPLTWLWDVTVLYPLIIHW